MDERQVRAAAIQASAALCAPFSYVQDGQIPDVASVLFVADVFAGYIEGGWPLALQVHEDGVSRQGPTGAEAPAVPPVEPPVQVVPDAPPEAPASAVEAQETKPPEGDGGGEVIEGKFGAGGKKQGEARTKIERIRRDKAYGILARARVAKVRAHKDRLIDEAESCGLNDFPVEINGSNMTLGAYLSSL